MDHLVYSTLDDLRGPVREVGRLLGELPAECGRPDHDHGPVPPHSRRAPAGTGHPDPDAVLPRQADAPVLVTTFANGRALS